jgi:hypothetical protein
MILCLLHHLLLEHLLLLGLGSHWALLLFAGLHASTTSRRDKLLLVGVRYSL